MAAPFAGTPQFLGAHAPAMLGHSHLSATAGFGTFHRWITGISCSVPSTDGAAVSRAIRAPSIARRPIHRAPITRLMWPCATRTTGPSPQIGPPRARAPGRLGPHLRGGLAAGHRWVHIVQPGLRSRISGAGHALVVAVVPFGQVVVDRVDAPARRARRCARPAAAGCTARGRDRDRASMPRRASACCSPCAVSGNIGAAGVPAGRGSTRSRRGESARAARRRRASVRAHEGRLHIGAGLRCRSCQSHAAFLVSQKIVSISAIRSSSFWPSAGSTAPLPPAAPAALVARLNRSCSCGYFSKCGGLK